MKLAGDGDFLAWLPVNENLLRKPSPSLSHLPKNLLGRRETRSKSILNHRGAFRMQIKFMHFQALQRVNFF